MASTLSEAAQHFTMPQTQHLLRLLATVIDKASSMAHPTDEQYAKSMRIALVVSLLADSMGFEVETALVATHVSSMLGIRDDELQNAISLLSAHDDDNQ